MNKLFLREFILEQKRISYTLKTGRCVIIEKALLLNKLELLYKTILNLNYRIQCWLYDIIVYISVQCNIEYMYDVCDLFASFFLVIYYWVFFPVILPLFSVH